MTDIARLGFEVDTAQLTRANTELRSLATNATAAEKAAARMSASVSHGVASVQQAAAGGVRATTSVTQALNTATTSTVAGQRAMAAGVTSATAAINAQGAAATRAGAAAVAAQNAAAAAATRNAAAQAAAGAATQVAANHNQRLATNQRGVAAATDGVTASVKSLSGAYAVLAAFLAGSVVIKAMDSYTQLQNSMRLTGLTGDDLVTVQNRLFDAATRNGVAIDDLTQLHRRLSLAQGELGVSQNRILNVVDGVSAAIRLQGTSAKSAQGTLLQLTQAFGSGTVRAEEFNSIMEGAFPIAQAAARGWKGGEISIGALRNKMLEGTVTSKEFFEALERGLEKTKTDAATMALTLGGSLTNVYNSFVKLMGGIDETTGVTKVLRDALKWVSDTLDGLSKNQEFMQGVQMAFDILMKIVKQTIEELKILVKILGWIFDNGVQLMRDLGAEAQRRTLADVTSEISKQKMDIVKANNLVTASTYGVRVAQEELDKVNAKGNASANERIRAVSELNKAHEILGNETVKQQAAVEALTKSEQKQLEVEREILRQSLGTPGVTPPPVTATELGRKSNLDDQGAGGGATAKGGKTKPLDPYSKIILDAQQYIKLQQMEAEALNKTQAEAIGLQKAQELLNKADDANLKLKPEQIKFLKELGMAMGQVTAETKLATFNDAAKKSSEQAIHAAKMEADTVLMSAQAAAAYKKQQDLIFQARQQGLPVGEKEIAQYKEIAEKTAAAEAASKRYTEAVKIGKEFMSDAFKGIITALREGTSLWDAFAAAANRALDKIIDKLADMAIDELMDSISSATKSASQAGSGGKSGTSASGGSSSMISDAISGVKNLFGSSSTAGSAFSGTGVFGTQGLFGGAVPTSSTVYGPQVPGALGAGGSASNLGTMGSFGGASAVSGGLAIAGGALSLATNKKPTTKSTIAGVGQMVGGALMMIPTGYTQIAGAIIIAASAILGAMGDAQPVIENQEYGRLTMGSSGFFTTGGAWGSDARAENMQGPLAAMGSTMDQVYKAFGGVKDAGKVWGVALQSYSRVQGDWNFQNKTSFLVSPSGMQTQWGQGSTDTDVGFETAGVIATVRSILEGAVGDITQNMRTALTNLGLRGKETFKSLSEYINEIVLFEATLASLGKTVTDADKALVEIDQGFAELYGTVAKFGLDKVQVDVKRDLARLEVSKNFIKGIDYALMTPLEQALSDLDADKAGLLANNESLKAVQGHVDQALRIEELYQKKRQEIIDDANAEAIQKEKERIENIKNIVSSLDDLIKQYTPGGDLAGVSATARIAGLKATYEAARSQAMAAPTDMDIVQKFIEASINFGNDAKDFYASDSRYIALRDQFIADAQALQAAAGGTPTGAAAGDPTSAANTNTQFSILMETVQDLTEQLEASQFETAKLQAQLSRYLANQ